MTTQNTCSKASHLRELEPDCLRSQIELLRKNEKFHQLDQPKIVSLATVRGTVKVGKHDHIATCAMSVLMQTKEDYLGADSQAP